MRISDCSSDVCSSDLGAEGAGRAQHRPHVVRVGDLVQQHDDPALGGRAWGRGSREDVLQPRLVERPGEEGEALVDAAVRQQGVDIAPLDGLQRSEEHTSELQSLMRISYAVFCLKKKK